VSLALNRFGATFTCGEDILIERFEFWIFRQSDNGFIQIKIVAQFIRCHSVSIPYSRRKQARCFSCAMAGLDVAAEME
jgi:hypothetical protein